jgi:hypothetical protein
MLVEERLKQEETISSKKQRISTIYVQVAVDSIPYEFYFPRTSIHLEEGYLLIPILGCLLLMV